MEERKIKVKTILAPLALAVLAAAAGAFAFSGARPVNLTPEGAGAAFISQLAAHRFDGALNSLSSRLRQDITLDRLRYLAASIEAHGPGILRAVGDGSSEFGERASARVIIQMADGQKMTVELLMVRENGAWKVYNFRDFLRVAYPNRSVLNALVS